MWQSLSPNSQICHTIAALVVDNDLSKELEFALSVRNSWLQVKFDFIVDWFQGKGSSDPVETQKVLTDPM